MSQLDFKKVKKKKEELLLTEIISNQSMKSG